MDLIRRIFLESVAGGATVSAASDPTSGNSNPSADLASHVQSLMGSLRIGTEFFLNKAETRQSIHRHFELMRETGLTLVRIFIIWDDVEHAPGTLEL